MTKRIAATLSLACVVSAGGCAAKKADGKQAEMDRGVTDLAPRKAVPASAVPPDPSFVYVPAAASQPKFVPVDAPAAVPPVPMTAGLTPVASPVTDPMAGIAATPASYASAAPYAAPAPTPAPVVTRTPIAPPAAAAPGAGGKSYLVQKGDTLFRIAKTHYGDGNRWQQIAMVNPGLSPATLKAGATIVVP